GHPAAALEPVEDAGDGGGVQAGVSRQGARAERTTKVDEVEAVEVDVFDLKMCADAMVEQGQLDVQLAQRLLDRDGQTPPTVRTFSRATRCYGTHIVCSSYHMKR